MPIVPRVTRTVEDSALPKARLSTTVPAGAFGGLDKTMDAAISLYEEQIKSVNQTVQLENDLKFSKKRDDIELAVKEQFKGGDAPGAYDWGMAEFKKLTSEVQDGLHGDTQKASVKNRAIFHEAALDGTLKNYVVAESGRHETSVKNSWEGVKVEEIIKASGNEALYQQGLTELAAELADRYKDPSIVNDKFNDYNEIINATVKQKRIDEEKASKDARFADTDAANKELTDLQIDGKLSYLEIRSRKGRLTDENYRLWADRQKQDLKDKEARIKEPVEKKEDKGVETALAVEAMTMPLNATSDDIYTFKKKVAEAVTRGDLKPSTGRAMIADAENATKMDPMRKAAEDAVVSALKKDLIAGLMGAGVEGDIEYTKQIEAFKRWSRVNKDKDPSEYYEQISAPYKEVTVNRFLGFISSGEPVRDFKRRREEIPQTMVEGAGKPTNTSYQVNEIYTDAQGREAKYLGEGKWQKMK